MIRILLIDDHAAVREAVGRRLAQEPDLRVVASFGAGSDAVRFAARAEPDVALLDLAFPPAKAADMALRLRAVSPKTRLLTLSLKECAGAEVVAAVRAAHA